MLTPPDVLLPIRADAPFARSWSAGDGYLSDEHRTIHAATRDLPGWQDPADSEKLYEMAYHSGAAILEVGVYGGRSAVVELRGAVAASNDRGLPLPQYYGLDIDPAFFDRAAKTLNDAGLTDRALLYHGDLRRFLREIPITPTMVFVDGDHSYEGVWADLNTLATALAPGTPVLCHDYMGIEGVRRAVDEWIGRGGYAPMGTFAGSILLKAVGVAHRRAQSLSPDIFDEIRRALWSRYAAARPAGIRRDRHSTPARELTRSARAELLGPRAGRIASGRAAWPYAPDPDAIRSPLPPTMPGGKPWPRVTVVTPSFNQGRFIEQTLLSVLNQGYPNLEYIVIDGGSTDETLSVIDRYRTRLAHFESRKDDGQADAISRGFARATGEILTWVNSDDLLAPGAVAAMALAFAQSGADIVSGEVRVHRDGKWVGRHLPICPDGPLPLDELLDVDGRWLQGQFFYQPETFFTRAIWEKAGARLDHGLYHSLDYDMWLRMAEAGAKLQVIGRTIAYFRAHPDQKTATDVVGGYRTELPKARDAAARRMNRPVPPAAPPAQRLRLRFALFNDLGYGFGAGIAHRRIAHALALAGHEVHVLSATSSEPYREPVAVTGDGLMARLDAINPDFVVVGNLHGAELDPTLLARIAARYDTACVMHDLWLLTGRCAYPGGCRRYLQQCHAGCTCPGDHPYVRPDLIRGQWETKRNIITGSPRLQLWPASPWTASRILEAMAGGTPKSEAASRVHPIRLGVETDIFRPRDRMTCRDTLGLPRDRFIIMSSASSLDDPRKGLRHLAEALDSLALDDVLVVSVGWTRGGDDPLPIPGMRAMGYMRDRQQLAMLYSASDLFVGPSLEEAFGQVFVEAAACGTASIGYPVGGVPQAILDGVSGRVAASVTPAALAEAIDELYHDAALRESMGRWGRLWVENEWSLEASARSMLLALRHSGVADRLGLVPRINFRLLPTTAPAPELLAPASGWRAISGFEPWAGPFPARGLPRCRWAHGPVAVFDLDADRDGPADILISCRVAHPRQRIRLIRDGNAIAEHSLGRGDRELRFRAKLARGPNRFELHSWRWNSGAKPLALIIRSIMTIPMATPEARNRVLPLVK